MEEMVSLSSQAIEVAPFNCWLRNIGAGAGICLVKAKAIDKVDSGNE